MKVAELEAPDLDLWVAKTEGIEPDEDYRPSSRWEHGGPLIEREGIALRRHRSGTWYGIRSSILGDGEQTRWSLERPGSRYGPLSYQVHMVQVRFKGHTPLVAAMRVLVASRFGNEVPDNT